ncbi:hypothetical protein ABZ820_34790 [Streptomyces diacarni]|uniref:hypothetical protein n=1 Tax=Streptomyces diacarni TaxID=2800381 RepID=UPI0033E82BB1
MTQPSPADEIRAAAAQLRALAEAAAEASGSATWGATRHFPELPDSTFTELWGSRPLMGGGGGRGRPPAYVSAPVGDYIAAMGPAVGLALAGWLESLAGIDVSEHHPLPDEYQHALTITRQLPR